MGGAAALIPGIVGIAGGEYAGYKKRQGEEEMLRNRIASAGRFLGEEQQPQRNSMGVPAPNIEQRNPLDPGIGGESTRRALEERSNSGMARKFAIEQAINGNVGPLNDMTKARMTPEKIVQDYGNSPQEGINPATGEIEQYLIEKNSGRQLWLGTKPVPKVEKASDYITRFNDWKLSNPKGTMMQFDAAAREPKEFSAPSFEYTNDGKVQTSYDMKNPSEVAAYRKAVSTPGIFKGALQDRQGQPTESQNAAGFLAGKIADSLGAIKTVVEKDPGAITNWWLDATENVPIFDALGRATASPNSQIIRNNLGPAIDSVLTLGTGAAYNKEQLVAERNALMPQPGEPNEVKKEKFRKFTVVYRLAKAKARSAGIDLPEVSDFENIFKPSEKPKVTSTAAVGGTSTVTTSDISNMSNEQLMKALQETNR